MPSGHDLQSVWLQVLQKSSIHTRQPQQDKAEPFDHRKLNPNPGQKPAWFRYVEDPILALDRSNDCFSKIFGDPYLECKLPIRGSSSLAGFVLKHAFVTVERLMDKHAPMVYKFGWTRDPHARFWNTKYGYGYDPHQKWQSMVVVAVSTEPVGPAYIEAALIQKYKGVLDKN